MTRLGGKGKKKKENGKRKRDHYQVQNCKSKSPGDGNTAPVVVRVCLVPGTEVVEGVLEPATSATKKKEEAPTCLGPTAALQHKGRERKRAQDGGRGRGGGGERSWVGTGWLL